MQTYSTSERLLKEQNECTLCWTKADGAPAAAIVSFIWARDSVWMTALSGSPRVNAIARDNRVAVVISGKGSPVGISRCLSLQGECVLHRDASVRDWFFPIFSAKVLPYNQQSAAGMAVMMNSPENLVLEMRPAKRIPYDSHEAMVSAGGG